MSFASAPLKLCCLHDLSQVAADWQRLETEGHCTAFQTRAWLQPFYDHLAPALGLEPLFLHVAQADTGRPLMLWPLVRQRRLGMSLLAFADAGVSDYNAPLLAAPSLPAEAWSQALQALRAQAALLKLDKLPSDAGLASVAGPAAAPLSYGTWAVDLPDSLAAYEQHCLAPAFAKDLAMRRRRLERKGAVQFERAATLEARRLAFEALVRQRARRFAETGRDDILGRPDFRRFYEAAAVHAPGDTVRLFTLAVDETVVAVMLAIDHAGTRHMVMPSFEAGEWKNCSPGNVLMLRAIGDAIAGGLRRFDFTIGDEAYKAGFGAVRQPVHGGLLPLAPAGRWAALGVDLARGLRQRLRRPAASA